MTHGRTPAPVFGFCERSGSIGMLQLPWILALSSFPTRRARSPARRSPKSAEKPRHSCRGGIGVGRAGLNAQEPNKTHAVPEPSMGEGTAEREAPAFMPGRTSPPFYRLFTRTLTP